jgi:phosphatidylglycerophosphatase A
MLTTFRDALSVTLATGFFVGRLPFAPGTFGSLAAAVLAAPVAAAGGQTALAIAALAAGLIGIPVADRAEKAMGCKDPGAIVIDEVAGQWIALIPAAPDLGSYILGFALFRLFDIVKPGPVGWADRKLSGGFGIMADDILAGALAALCLALAGPFLPPVLPLF